MTARSSGSDQLTPDEIFEVLSNHRRRMVLYYLRQHGGSSTVNELADQIASMENEVPPEDLTSQQRKRVYVSLYQTHLPKLDDMNIINYDVEAGTVELTNQSTEMDAYLTSMRGAPYPWKRHYAALVILGVALLVLSAIDAPLIGAVSMTWLLGVILVAYLVSVSIQYIIHRRQRSGIPMELAYHEK